MRKLFEKLVNKFKHPSGLFAVFAMIIAVGLIACSIVIVVLEPQFGVLAYVFYLLAALSAAYLVYLIIFLCRGGMKNVLDKYTVVRKLREDFELRTIVFAICSFCASIAIAAFDCTLAALNASLWFGSLAGYYMVLAILRGSVLLSRRRGRKRGETEQQIEARDERAHLSCGILMIALALFLSGVLVIMVRDNRSFGYLDLTVYVFAAYAFTKITLAVYNLIKARRSDDFSVKSIRYINLSDALVSILALQTALLQMFGEGDTTMTGKFNAITGLAVFLIMIAMGTIMIVRAGKRIGKRKEEDCNGREQ